MSRGRSVSAARASATGQGVVRVYLATTAMFTLATSLIWGVNTLFLLDAGLDLFQVMIVNGAYSLGQMLFEVPTGVVADTIGRRASYALGIFTLFVSTALYVASARFGWGIGGFLFASVLLGLGYTFQTGAVDAWLVDALDHLEHVQVRSEVFARGGMVGGVTMLVGTLAGGFLGQANLMLPYVVRALILLVALVAVLVLMRDIGFEPRPLKLSRFGAEARTIFDAGITHGWRSPVVRPLMLVSAAQGTFMMFFFYSSQPYALELLGRTDLIWVAGVLTAMFGLTGVIGNLCVGPVTRTSWGKSATRVLSVGALLLTLLTLVLGIVGVATPSEGNTASFAVMVVVLALFGVVFGVVGPIRQAFINEHIPSGQRATVLSFDSFFGDAGGAIGQPGFGWLSRAASIPVSYLVGAAMVSLAVPFYRRAGRCAVSDECADVRAPELPATHLGDHPG